MSNNDTINISALIHPELIISEVVADVKEEALMSIVKRICKFDPESAGEFTPEDIYEVLMERENRQSTGLGKGVAFPHARIKGWKNFTVAFGFSSSGIEFNSLDNQPVHLICLMISSEEDTYVILQVMSLLNRFLKKVKYDIALLKELSAGQLKDALKRYSIRKNKVIFAGDIMSPVRSKVSIDTPIDEVAHIMHLKQLDVLPVVDHAGAFCGQITCFDIFTYGIPDFFKQLNTVSFVRHIDPFEKYFKIKKSATAGDLMTTNHKTISQKNTLLEIVFDLAIKNKEKLFIVDGGKLVGEIDRFSIIDKILFF